MKQKNMGAAWGLFFFGLFITLLGVMPLAGLWGNIDQFGKNFSWFILVCGIVLLVLTAFVYRANKARYQKFYQLFPELEGNLDLLVTDADLHSKAWGFAIYKGYMVSYKGTLVYVDLKDVWRIAYRTESVGRYNGKMAYFSLLLKDKKKSRIPLPYYKNDQVEPALAAVSEYLQINYPHIELN